MMRFINFYRWDVDEDRWVFIAHQDFGENNSKVDEMAHRITENSRDENGALTLLAIAAIQPDTENLQQSAHS